MKKIIEQYYKIITIILILIGLGLILNLWWFGVNFVCGGGGWINLCIIGNLEYSRTNAGYISVLFGIISLILMYIIRKTEKKSKKVILAFMIFLMGILGKPLFYMVSPDFKFYYNGEKEYINNQGELINLDLYLEKMGKYCDDSIDNFKFRRVYRSDMCAGQYVIDLKTVKEYGKVFDYANKHNLRELYRLTYIGAEDFGLEKIIKSYHDDTFYAYVIKRNSNLILLNQIKDNIKNITLLNALNGNIESINYILNNENKFDMEEGYKYWDSLSDNFNKKLKQISTVNTKVL